MPRTSSPTSGLQRFGRVNSGSSCRGIESTRRLNKNEPHWLGGQAILKEKATTAIGQHVYGSRNTPPSKFIAGGGFRRRVRSVVRPIRTGFRSGSPHPGFDATCRPDQVRRSASGRASLHHATPARILGVLRIDTRAGDVDAAGKPRFVRLLSLRSSSDRRCPRQDWNDAPCGTYRSPGLAERQVLGSWQLSILWTKNLAISGSTARRSTLKGGADFMRLSAVR